MVEKRSISDSQTDSKAFMKEVMKLSPSSVVNLYEIDLSNLLLDNQHIFSLDETKESDRILRFHNSNVFLQQRKNIIWNGKKFFPAAIRMSGFESTLQGTIPKPVMGISSSEQTLEAFAILKDQLSKLDDLVGAKVTRYKTFIKFLDFVNFEGVQPPQDFSPGIKAEFPREIYYIERKSNENKFTLEFELAANLDVEGVRIPRRIVLKERCPWSYRGAGCCYEFPNLLNSEEHGDRTLPTNFKATPKAISIGHEIKNILKTPENSLVNKGNWGENVKYNVGDYVYVTKDNINYYFVAKKESLAIKPPNMDYWLADECTKDLRGCRLRWQDSGLALPYGGFPSAMKQRKV